MKEISKELNKIIEETRPKLSLLSHEEWNFRSSPGKWSKKQILGHLIDSAANNHQRFVRVQFEETPTIRYNQDNWSDAQDFDNASLNNLIELWGSYNNHLAYIISRIPEEKYNRLCNIGKENSATLQWIAADYVRHLKHHLNQIIE